MGLNYRKVNLDYFLKKFLSTMLKHYSLYIRSWINYVAIRSRILSNRGKWSSDGYLRLVGDYHSLRHTITGEEVELGYCPWEGSIPVTEMKEEPLGPTRARDEQPWGRPNRSSSLGAKASSGIKAFFRQRTWSGLKAGKGIWKWAGEEG